MQRPRPNHLWDWFTKERIKEGESLSRDSNLMPWIKAERARGAWFKGGMVSLVYDGNHAYLVLEKMFNSWVARGLRGKGGFTGEMMEMYLKALAARNAEAVKPPKVAPGRAKEAPKAPVAKEEPKPAPAPAQADLPVDFKSLAAGEDDWDAFEQAEVVETSTETEVVE